MSKDTHQHYTEYEVSHGKASPVFPNTGQCDEDEYRHWFLYFGNQELYAPHLPDGKISVNDVEFVGCELRLKEVVSTSGKTGIELITEKRNKHIAKGWTLEHDQEHKNGELATVAACLATNHTATLVFTNIRQDISTWGLDKHPTIEQLAIAGSLIAAEIDRINLK